MFSKPAAARAASQGIKTSRDGEGSIVLFNNQGIERGSAFEFLETLKQQQNRPVQQARQNACIAQPLGNAIVMQLEPEH